MLTKLDVKTTKRFIGGADMTNTFESETNTYVVLVNKEGQYSLWPSFSKVPLGWTVVLEAAERQVCLDYVKKNWTDMRPKSLVEAMNEGKRDD